MKKRPKALCSFLFIALVLGCRKAPDVDVTDADTTDVDVTDADTTDVAWSDSDTLVLMESTTAEFWIPSDLVIGCDDGVARVISSMICEDGTEWVWDREKGVAVRR